MYNAYIAHLRGGLLSKEYGWNTKLLRLTEYVQLLAGYAASPSTAHIHPNKESQIALEEANKTRTNPLIVRKTAIPTSASRLKASHPCLLVQPQTRKFSRYPLLIHSKEGSFVPDSA